EAEDHTVLNSQRQATNEPNAVESTVTRALDAIDPYIAQDYPVACPSVDNDTVRASDQDRGHLASTTVNGDSFGDGDGAIARRIKGINLAACSGLGNCSGKGLAGGGAAAGVGIVADAGNPGPRCLS